MIKGLEELLENKIVEECGVFGIYNVKNASQLTYYGLHALQHRGQQGSGIATFDGEKISRYRGEGLVIEIFNSENISQLKGNYAIGHVRMGSDKAPGIENIQPLLVRSHTGDFTVAHNGRIINYEQLRTQLEYEGSIFQTSSSSEIICHLIQKQTGTFTEKIKKAVEKLEGSFAFVIMTEKNIYAIRDKNGFSPLAIAKLDDGFVISSETVGFEMINAQIIRDVKPGEIIKIGKKGLRSIMYAESTQSKMCAMEYIYLARPDSNIDGINVHSSRRKCGRVLAEEFPCENADIVIGVPDSSLSAAMGYSDGSKLPYEIGLIKNRYIGRTFIQPTQEEREKGVKMKLSPVSNTIKGKSIVLVDDSIVRGTTSKYIIKLLKEAGAKEVHVRIASPAMIAPCFYGVDTSSLKDLISARMSVEELRDYIGADSLAFLSNEGLKKGLGNNICSACFDREYPTYLFDLDKNFKKELKELEKNK
ncbi:MAG: amidophosphoribosyltransferase [Fusobacterium sp. JB021]|nr:amidophosphoribosyltransferase [Fusobacterium sp. JB021]MDP0507364.1 amidophosphoribosyltransferase [Fusobacterium sp. JB019]